MKGRIGISRSILLLDGYHVTALQALSWISFYACVLRVDENAHFAVVVALRLLAVSGLHFKNKTICMCVSMTCVAILGIRFRHAGALRALLMHEALYSTLGELGKVKKTPRACPS